MKLVRLGIAGMAALTIGTTASAQQIVTGSTQGCFTTSPAATCSSYGTNASIDHLSFKGRNEGPFTLTEGSPFTISNLGAFKVANGTDNYDNTEFFLRFVFTAPGSGDATAIGDVSGMVHGNDGDISVAFSTGTVTIGDDIFSLNVNPISHSDTDTNTLSGTLTYVSSVTTTPEPASIALLGTGLFGLVPMVRRKK